MWNKFNSFIRVIRTSTFRNGDILSTPVQDISVSVSNGSVNYLSTCKIKSILLLTLDFDTDPFSLQLNYFK